MSAVLNSVQCASCSQPMAGRTLASVTGPALQIDVCHPCHAFWFDRNESLLLAPGAVIELFQDIHRHRDDARRPLAERSKCPHCRTALLLTHDVSKAGPFVYYRCPQGHGRLTPFSEFLREKQFVRSLSPAELVRVRAELKTVRCSGCGAPIDLERESACSFCHAPLSILDPDAVERALKMWSDAEARRKSGPSPEKVAAALLDMHALRSKARRDAKRWSPDSAIDTADVGGDLLGGAIEILGDLLSAIDL